MIVSQKVKTAAYKASRFRKDEGAPEKGVALLQSVLNDRENPVTDHEKAVILIGLADCHRALHNRTSAGECLRDAVQAAPRYSYGLNAFARFLEFEGLRDQARKYYVSSLECQPGNDFAMEGLARIDRPSFKSHAPAPKLPLAENRNGEAPPVSKPAPVNFLESLRVDVRNNPEQLDKRLSLARILALKDEADEAAEHLWAVLEKDAVNEKARALLHEIRRPLSRPVSKTDVIPSEIQPAANDAEVSGVGVVIPLPAAALQERPGVTTVAAREASHAQTEADSYSIRLSFQGMALAEVTIVIPAGVDSSDPEIEQKIQVAFQAACETQFIPRRPNCDSDHAVTDIALLSP